VTIQFGVVDEPTSPAVTAPADSVALHYTPASSAETLVAGEAGGPTGRVRVEVSLDGGSSWHALPYAVGGTAGVEQVILLRYVGLPFGDAPDLDPTRLGFATVEPGVDAGWRD